MEGLPIFDDFPGGSEYTVMVIDDLMEEASKSKTAMDIFTKHSHHRNMTVLFLVQKLYGWRHNTRVISQNAHLMILRHCQRSEIGTSDVPMHKPY